ncbi:MAG: exodeoxyribonuclease I, partial [Aquabacterium sp.]|nr:exodeoxyribonuclease I [Aquabacterium sp.]
ASMAGIWAEVFERPSLSSSPAVDVDEDLYGGFLSQHDRRTLDRIRALTAAERAQKLADRSPAFEDERLEELLFRYRARNFEDSLSEEEQERWHQHCSERLHQGQGGALSLAQFFERIDTLSEQLSDEDERGQDILGALYDYAEQIAP